MTFKTNKRRNLNSGQWATIAVEAEDIMGAIAEESKARQARKPSDSVSQLIVEQKPSEQRTDHKAAEIFQTNRTYINQATKIKKASPEFAGWSTSLTSLQKLHLWHPQRIPSASSLQLLAIKNLPPDGTTGGRHYPRHAARKIKGLLNSENLTDQKEQVRPAPRPFSCGLTAFLTHGTAKFFH